MLCWAGFVLLRCITRGILAGVATELADVCRPLTCLQSLGVVASHREFSKPNKQGNQTHIAFRHSLQQSVSHTRLPLNLRNLPVTLHKCLRRKKRPLICMRPENGGLACEEWQTLSKCQNQVRSVVVVNPRAASCDLAEIPLKPLHLIQKTTRRLHGFGFNVDDHFFIALVSAVPLTKMWLRVA